MAARVIMYVCFVLSVAALLAISYWPDNILVLVTGLIAFQVFAMVRMYLWLNQPLLVMILALLITMLAGVSKILIWGVS